MHLSNILALDEICAGSIPTTATTAASPVCQLLSSREDKDMPLFSSLKFKGKREGLGKFGETTMK